MIVWRARRREPSAGLPAPPVELPACRMLAMLPPASLAWRLHGPPPASPAVSRCLCRINGARQNDEGDVYSINKSALARVTSKLAPPTIGRLMGTIRAQGHRQASPPPPPPLHLLCQPLPRASGLALVLLAPSEMSCHLPVRVTPPGFAPGVTFQGRFEFSGKLIRGKCQGGTRCVAEEVLTANISEGSSA